MSKYHLSLMKNKETIDNDSEGDNTFSYITRQNLNSEHGIVALMTLFSCIIKVHSVTVKSVLLAN